MGKLSFDMAIQDTLLSSNVLTRKFPAGLPPSPSISSSSSLEEFQRQPSLSSDRFEHPNSSHLLDCFLHDQHSAKAYRTSPVLVDGYSLTVPAVTAVARHQAPVRLDESPEVRERMAKSRNVVDQKLKNGTSIYGISTGFGGSADTRTKAFENLGYALLQHQHSGILPSHTDVSDVLPLSDPYASLTMPQSWVRSAILVRINSLVRGHSAVRYEVVSKMRQLIEHGVIPLVPLRGSISASGDLSPLSYVAGTLIGERGIKVHYQGKIIPAPEALAKAGIEPLRLMPKEHLGILNGTAFSAGLGALVMDDSVQMGMMGALCTALGVEALAGSSGSFASWIHEVARPHPGQIESARLILYLLNGSALASKHQDEKEVTVDEDVGVLRQDRYPLRTSPQFLGPQFEDIMSAYETIQLECNSTTDNPLVDGETGMIHHAGNFQAMAVSNALEKTRLALHHVGKLLFSQLTELLNPAFNTGLPPSLATTDPSLNYHCKGLDIATAAYVAELGQLANPVTTHIQSAEMHNQAVNSMALVCARRTLESVDVLSMIISNYLYVLCHGVELRAMQKEFKVMVTRLVNEELGRLSGLTADTKVHLAREIPDAFMNSVDATSTMDAVPRMTKAAEATSVAFIDALSISSTLLPIASVKTFQTSLATRAARALQTLRYEYLSGARGSAPASGYLGRTKAVYEFIRLDLGVRMHGLENYDFFGNLGDDHKSMLGDGGHERTIGENVSIIYQALRDGGMAQVLTTML